MIIHSRCFADEQRVEFGETRVVLFLDQFDIDTQLFACRDETLQCLGVGRRQGFVRIMEDGQVVAGHTFGGGLTPRSAIEGIQCVSEDMLLFVAKLVQRPGLDACDLPGLTTAEFHQQDRAGERLEQLTADLLQRLDRGLAEVQRQRERLGFAVWMIGQRPLQGALQIVQPDPVKRFARQLADGAHRGKNLVPARLGQQ